MNGLNQHDINEIQSGYSNEDETSVKMPLLLDHQSTDFHLETGSASDLTENRILKLPPGKDFHLFVSHSSDDVTEVDRLREDITKRFGLKCLNYESDFKGGHTIEDCVKYGFRISVKVLVILSPSFLKSQWCMGELYETLGRASKLAGESLIIPVILRPIEEIPLTLKPYRCIDAQNVDDLAAKIHEAYYFSAKINEQPFSSYTKEDILKQNGARVLVKNSEILGPFIKRGNVYRFPPLDDDDRQILNSLNVHVDDHYTAVQTTINDHWFIRRYKVFVGGKLAIVFSTVLSLVVSITLIASAYLDVIITRNTKTVDEAVPFVAGIFLGCFIWLLSFLSIKMFRPMLVKKLHERISKVNMKYVDTSKCLVMFENTVLDRPSTYLKILLDRRYFEESEDYRMTMANDKIKSKLEELQVKGQLTAWPSLPDQLPNDSNRHNMWGRKQCLCQMLEKEIIPVITV